MSSQPIPGYSPLPARGNPIGSGAEGTVFDLPGYPDWVLKEFQSGTIATQASNEANNLDALRRVFGNRHVVQTVTPPGRFVQGQPVVLLKEKVTIVVGGEDQAALKVIADTLKNNRITADVGKNLVWGTPAVEWHDGSGSNNRSEADGEVVMDFLESRREAADRLLRYAATQGADIALFRDEYDVFSNRKRWIDFWLEGDTVGYHLRGEVRTLPAQFATSQSSFRGIWDEAGSTDDLQHAWELLRSWLIEGKELDELTNRQIHRSLM